MVGHLYGALVEGDHRRHAAFNEFSFESRNSRGGWKQFHSIAKQTARGICAYVSLDVLCYQLCISREKWN